MPPDRDWPAPLVVQPLQEAFSSFRDGLRGRVRGYRSDLNGYWGTVLALLHASDQTMRAAFFLVGDERIEDQKAGKGPGLFPAQAIILQRSLLEVLGNILVLSENRIYRDSLFRRDGYREDARQYKALVTKLAAGTLLERKKADWTAALQRWDEQLQKEARFLRLTPAEISDPGKELRSWPSPSKMLDQKDPAGADWLSGNRLEVFRYFYQESYGPDSRVVHQKDRALHLSVKQAAGMTLDELAHVRNIPVLRGATLHASVIGEVGHEFGWPKQSRRNLRTVWAHLIQAFDPALEVYRLHYRRLLSRRD